MHDMLTILLNNQFLVLALIALLIIILTVLITTIRKYNIDYNRKMIKEQLDIIKEVEELENKEQVTPTKIENLLEQMEHKLERKVDNSLSFEEEQEGKAIISYQELLKNKREPVSDFVDFDDLNQNIEPELLEVDLPELNNSFDTFEETKKFRNTDFISPVFGRNPSKFNYQKIVPIEIYQSDEPIIETKKYQSEQEDIIPQYKLHEIEVLDDKAETNIDFSFSLKVKESDGFLSALKEFRRNLE